MKNVEFYLFFLIFIIYTIKNRQFLKNDLKAGLCSLENVFSSTGGCCDAVGGGDDPAAEQDHPAAAG